jgi:hypothetical protein
MHVHVQRLVSVVRMATMLEECATIEQYSVAFFVVKSYHLSNMDKGPNMISLKGY